MRRRLTRSLAAVTELECKRLLGAYLPIALKLRALYRLPADELRAVAEEAILHAYLTHDQHEASEAHWVRKTLHWWLADAVKAMGPSHLSLDADPQIVNGHNPEQAFLQALAVQAMGRLPPRHQQIVDGIMRGETYEEIGDSISVSPQRTHVEGQKAFDLLRCNLEGEDKYATEK